MIAYALLDSVDASLVLADIYQYIIDKYPYYKHTSNSWRTSIRHNLSVNECFVKGKRSKNGRGYFWSIHSSCLDSFKNGDFDRRKARRQVQKCNRAFSSAFTELQNMNTSGLRIPATCAPTYTQDHAMASYSCPMVPQSQYQQHNIGGTEYMTPVTSTPVQHLQHVPHYQYQYHKRYDYSYHGYYQ